MIERAGHIDIDAADMKRLRGLPRSPGSVTDYTHAEIGRPSDEGRTTRALQTQKSHGSDRFNDIGAKNMGDLAKSDV